MTSDLHAMLETAQEAARTGGSILMDAFGTLRQNQIDLKGRGDYVTELDRRSEEAIIQMIRARYPDHAINAEESGESGHSPFRWLVDPLDGTANYVQGIPIFAVSIAVLKGDDILAGVVFHPDRDEMFTAVRQGGAFLNGRPIRVSDRQKMAYAMLASGFPWRSKDYLDPYLECFKRLFLDAAGIRRMGAAAIDLAYTACGRFDGFWEMKLGPWDIAAGILLIREAGGVATDFHGGEAFLSSGNVVAGSKNIHSQILEVIRDNLAHIH